MKINCGPSPWVKAAAERARLRGWHDFFTWKPRRLGENDCRWLETIERREVVIRTAPAGEVRYVFGIGPVRWPTPREICAFEYRSKA